MKNILVTTTAQGIDIKLTFTNGGKDNIQTLTSDTNSQVLFENIDLTEDIEINPVNSNDRIVSIVTQTTE